MKYTYILHFIDWNDFSAIKRLKSSLDYHPQLQEIFHNLSDSLRDLGDPGISNRELKPFWVLKRMFWNFPTESLDWKLRSKECGGGKLTVQRARNGLAESHCESNYEVTSSIVLLAGPRRWKEMGRDSIRENLSPREKQTALWDLLFPIVRAGIQCIELESYPGRCIIYCR